MNETHASESDYQRGRAEDHELREWEHSEELAYWKWAERQACQS